jgi:hypothetical protein
MLIIKRTDAAYDWTVYHKGLGNDIKFLELNNTDAVAIGDGALTSTTFKVNDDGYGYDTNVSGGTYVAYLFAHDPDGEDDDGMIACGSWASGFTGNISLGWEPQYMLWKASSGTGDWKIFDSMRGIVTGGNDAKLKADESEAETSSNDRLDLNADGFSVNANFGEDFIYMAIRAPMMVEPKAGSEVFAMDNGGSGVVAPTVISNFPVDMAFWSDINGDHHRIASRLTGAWYLETDSTAIEGANNSYRFDYNNGFFSTTLHAYQHAKMFKRAKGFFDVVAYTGNGTAGRTVNHSLSVAPEMMWVKRRNTGGNDSHWTVYHHGLDNDGDGLPATDYILLDTDDAEADYIGLWNDTAPSSSVFTLGSLNFVNYSGDTYIAYLFASLDGVSKVGSYTGNGTNQNIACGFSAGARFVLIKRTDSSGDWYTWDTERGIVAGNDPHLSLNSASAEVSDDSIDPQSAGFTVNQVSATNINVSSGTYIFLAIA